jgi:hypothetical protein
MVLVIDVGDLLACLLICLLGGGFGILFWDLDRRVNKVESGGI